MTHLRTMRHDLLQRAVTDAETGLPNRRFLELERERVVARSHRYGFPIGLITVTCHGCGTDVPRRLGQAASRTVRRADFLARTGPTELQLLGTHRDTEGLPAVVDRLREPAQTFGDESLRIEVEWTVEEPSGTTRQAEGGRATLPSPPPTILCGPRPPPSVPGRRRLASSRG